jgi:hypothetical protein
MHDSSLPGESRRDWDFGKDGPLEGLYVETREVLVANGPSAGRTKLVFDFHVGVDEETVSVWESTVLRRKMAAELRRRNASDFEPGERIKIARSDSLIDGRYWDFPVVEFEHAAPKKTTAELLAAGESESESDDDISFGDL